MTTSGSIAVRSLRMSDLISALSFALDLTEGQPMGHAVKCCILGMRLADQLQLMPQEKSDLYYALLLKDVGCSSNAARMYEILGGDELKAKREAKTIDWRRIGFEALQYVLRNAMPGRSTLERLLAIASMAIHRDQQSRELVQIRCNRGADIARKIGLSETTAQAIFHLDEHWDGGGYPNGKSAHDIPLCARILNVCQTLEVYAALNGPSEAQSILEQRSGKWFDPELVRAAREITADVSVWEILQGEAARDTAIEMEPLGVLLFANEAQLDNVCEAFADVIDVKSPFTHEHSRSVARVAEAIVTHMGLDKETVIRVRRAALLHDIGKLSVPNCILDKPGKLTAQEWEAVRLHPYYTQRILEKVSGFQRLAFLASTHHEKLDGTGYYRNLRGAQLPLASRAIATADIFDALSAKRPYRDSLPREKVFDLIARDVPRCLDGACFEALRAVV
jgi:putative nucleotidyltransferase with HDIG domain